MAESPRTAQNVDHIMEDTEEIAFYLKTLAERDETAETRDILREILAAISRLAATIEGVHSSYVSVHNELMEKLAGHSTDQLPVALPAYAPDVQPVVPDQRTLFN